MNKLLLVIVLFFSTILMSYSQLWPETIGYPNDVRFWNIDTAIIHQGNDSNNVILILKYETEYDKALQNEDLKRLKEIKNLKAVIIYNQPISKLPRSFKKLQLTYLSIRQTKLTKFPHRKIDDKIETLSFEGNPVKSIKGISNLNNLSYLNLSGNLIDNLGEEIYFLDSLKQLILSANPLRESDVNICNFKNLKSLYLDETGISNLPNGIECLERTLSIRDCNIKFLSTELKGTNLTAFYFDLNQLKDQLEDLSKTLGGNCKIFCTNIFGSCCNDCYNVRRDISH